MAKDHPTGQSGLYEAFLQLKTPEQCYRFLQDVCSYSELSAMEQRFNIAEMLADKRIYTEIMDKTGASSAIISRVSRVISKDDSVLRRLQQVGQPDQFVPDDPTNAEQLRYSLIWPAVADDRVDHYELWAREQAEDGSLGAAEKLHPADLDADGKEQAITGTQTVVDLEAYQGKKLVFYVVACPKDGSTDVLRSPNGEESAPQTIVSRTDVPQISGVTFNWTGKAATPCR